MKKIILFSLFCFLFFTPISKAQESTSFSNTDPINGITKTSFFEWNFGVAFVSFDTNHNFYFPGSSALWGTTFINQDNLIIEYEVGFAFPTLVTGKIGVGKRFNNTNVVVGLRPWPLNLYAQTSFSTNKNRSWIASIEFSPLTSRNISIGSPVNFNVGYRWNILIKNSVKEIE
tara:strand:+ start:92 stop:610 length:519 start_codon:yes stop_codon:yes gene_type:complete